MRPRWLAIMVTVVAASSSAWAQEPPDAPPAVETSSRTASSRSAEDIPSIETSSRAASPRVAEDLSPAETSSRAASPRSAEDLPPAGQPGSMIARLEAEPPRPPTAAEVDAPRSLAEQLARREKELRYYRSGTESYAEDMRALLRRKYERQRELLAAQYDRRIEELELKERRRRLEAIARFEEFLRKYPDDPIYTPDAMFRLAELHFEKSSDDYLQRSKGYEAELIAFEEGRRESEPQPPEPSYEKTIGLHRDLVVRFPSYRLADAARYLLGYCYSEQGQSDEALVAYLDLTRNHPGSDFLAEVWTRIGEIYFDGSSKVELEKAISSYIQVLDFPDSPYYDKALYKIAWTYYRLDRFGDAVRSFIGLVNYADERKRLTGVTGSELRSEAIQYIAISLSDEEWGGLERAQAVLGSLEDRDYAGELWKQYGDILFDQTRYALAIRVLEYTLKKYPDAPYNPEAQEKIVRAYEAQRDFSGATEAREALVARFSEGSSWYVANRTNLEVITKAASMTERSLYTAAIFRHQQAQADKRAGRAERARGQYLSAADSYKDYLRRFPRSKNAYDFEFFLAECLYYSDRYLEAAKQYDAVRDSTLDDKHLEAAALSAVIAYEKAVETQEKAGALASFPLRTAAERLDKKINPQGIAALRQELIGASDRFAQLLPDSARVPAIQYRTAEIFYRHDQFEEARRRFEDVIRTYPTSEVAQYASNLIIESYLAAKDWQSVEEWSQRLIELAKNAKGPADPSAKAEFIANLNTFKVGAQFKRAQDFDAAGKFEAAANTYVRLVDEDPKNEFADKALFNAAVAYEKVKRFDTASKIYDRIYQEYPRSALAPRALFRVGINAEKGFDFPSAIGAYAKLVKRYPKSDKRADALYNQAVVLENMQRYREAADAYLLYAKTFPKRDDAGAIFFRASLVYEKMKDWASTVDALRQFIRRYGRKAQYAEKVIESLKKVGTAYQAQGSSRLAQKTYRDCVQEFARRGLSVRSRAARYAAQCEFQRAEVRFARYDDLSITGSGRRQIKALTEKAKSQRSVEKAYQRVFRYKRAEETLAASFRIGYSYERFADTLFAAPIPKEFESDEELANEYRAQLEERAAVLERKAEAAYRKAYAEAKRTNLSNEWTQRILEGLHKYAPGEFPIQKAGKAALQTTTLTGFGLDALERTKPPSAPAAPPPGASRSERIRRPRTAQAGGHR